MSSSSKAAGTDVAGKLIGGRAARMTDWSGGRGIKSAINPCPAKRDQLTLAASESLLSNRH